MAKRCTVHVTHPDGQQTATVGWFVGASEMSIRQSIASALDLKSLAFFGRDQDGDVVALSSSLPTGTLLTLEYVQPGGAGSGSGHGGQRALNFRGQVLKFERVQAHLANERTWLAWVRTALSALSIAFSLLTMSEDATSQWLAVSLFVTGSFMVSNVLFTFITGWLRYVRVKDVLMLSKSEMTEHFGRFGLSHHARFLSAILLFISVLYISGSGEISS